MKKVFLDKNFNLIDTTTIVVLVDKFTEGNFLVCFIVIFVGAIISIGLTMKFGEQDGYGEEWGPWIDHDGCSFPVPVGTVVNVERFDGTTEVFMVGRSTLLGGKNFSRITKLRKPSSWMWGSLSPSWGRGVYILRYRVKKPKGLQILESLLQNLDDKIKVGQPLEIQT